PAALVLKVTPAPLALKLGPDPAGPLATAVLVIVTVEALPEVLSAKIALPEPAALRLSVSFMRTRLAEPPAFVPKYAEKMAPPTLPAVLAANGTLVTRAPTSGMAPR